MNDNTHPLSPAGRLRALEGMETSPIDILVIGGGIGYWCFAVKRHSVVDQNDHCN